MGVFVKPEVRRYPFKYQDVEFWIEVKRRLTTGELKRMQSAGIVDVQASRTQSPDEARLGLDMARLSLARCEAYLVDWNLTDDNGKTQPVTRATIEALDPDVFDLIDKLLDEHVTAQEKEKNAPRPVPNSTPS